MKKYGKVKDYNGVYGTIKGIDGLSYTLLDNNTQDEEIKESDDVVFEEEYYKTPEIKINIAKSVKVLKKTNNK